MVVALADGAGCGMVADIDPMSAKRREFPRAGTVVSVPVGKQFRAYIMSLSGGSSFWLFDFLTTLRVCDRSLFEFSVPGEKSLYKIAWACMIGAWPAQFAR